MEMQSTAAGTLAQSQAAAAGTGNSFTYADLHAITDGFSDEIGRGGFGVVYRGKLPQPDGEEVAVKRLTTTTDNNNPKQPAGDDDDEQFEKELGAVRSIQHENIVEFVGYCNGYTPSSTVLPDGRPVYRKIRALCFKYMEKGSLRKHVADESLDWQSRYEIIKGVCEGLNHLHSKGIVHRDLKLDNILLDGAMKPKIADFGLSRFMGAQETTRITRNIVGTFGCMPPEFFCDGQYSKSFDVYSLGTVIKEILAGPAAADDGSIYGYYDPLKKASEYWEQRLVEDADVQRVKACIELVPLCWGLDRKKRPTIERVLDTLNYTDISVQKEQHYYCSRSSGPQPEKSRLEGGAGGELRDIDMEVTPPPHRLKAVWLKHGAVIDSLQFSYTDCDGREQGAGPWGSQDAWDKVLQLEPYEFLVGVSGTTGGYAGLPTSVIRSLTFVTNVRTYRTRGAPVGDPFALEAPAGSCIVGFHARAGHFLDALGVYHRPI
ncbi:putative receptor-like protein kinase At4g00960 isoform X2 [Zea mays]|uniref:Cysteine-rich receptor-like protein kinase 40 n=1 Tax=Zea mays TaxID=4577 RepID=A0A1D6FPK3_MAIZE|nr:putative receptor-like protein kinase At4g00960 isoform X2 [Zea mays]AQK93556.1 Cysteine-rich receptor-like protein kinase 40 [Zea mays]|eukprot:XP_008656248.1 putative receptor-like protein kinase At4g00960 isoform X2 [Zea mays]